MKVRQAYEGRVIEARSSELKDGGWDCEFSIEEHETTGLTERAFYVPGIFPTAEAAIEAAVTAGQQKIDSGFEYKPVVEFDSKGCRVEVLPSELSTHRRLTFHGCFHSS